MPDRSLALGIQAVPEPNDAEALASAAEQLHRELLEFDVDTVVPAPGERPPPGTRAGGAGGDVFELTKLSSGERSRLADQWLARQTDS